MRRLVTLAAFLVVVLSVQIVWGDLQPAVTNAKFGFKVQAPTRWDAQPLPPATDYKSLGVDEDIFRLLIEETNIEPLLIYKGPAQSDAEFRLFRMDAKDIDAASVAAEKYAKSCGYGASTAKADFKPKCPKTTMKKITFSRSNWGDQMTILLLPAINANGAFLLSYQYYTAQKQYISIVEDSAKSFAFAPKETGTPKPGKKNELPAGWNQIETENYIIQYNDDNVDKVKLFAKRIERLHTFHAKLLPRKPEYEKNRPKAMRGKLTVKYFKDRNGFDGYAGDQGVYGAAAYFSPGQNEIAFYLTGWTKETMCILYHEATHQYLQEFVGGPRVDFHTWINEGTSEYFFAAGSDDADKVALGTTLKDGLQTVKADIKNNGVIPIKNLIEMTQREYYAEGRRAYDYGWSLVHFLQNSPNKQYNEVLPRYFYYVQATAFPILLELEKLTDITKNSKKGPKVTIDGEGDEGDDKEDEAWEKKRELTKQLDEVQAKAQETAFSGINIDQLQKDWEAFYR